MIDRKHCKTFDVANDITMFEIESSIKPIRLIIIIEILHKAPTMISLGERL
jgi:hypothetical protein